MFNSKQGEKNSEVFSINSLGIGSSVTGDIMAVSDMRIDGKVKGNISCDARLIIGETGEIEGDVTCKAAIIQGKLTGTLKVSETLEVNSKAIINGEIATSRLIVENGAVFNVRCSMTSGRTVKHENQK